MSIIYGQFYFVRSIAHKTFLTLNDSSLSVPVHAGTALTLAPYENAILQTWYIANFDDAAKMGAQKNIEYLVNYHTGNASAIVWPIDDVTPSDSKISLSLHDAAHDIYRICLVDKNLYLTTSTQDGILYWAPFGNDTSQLFYFMEGYTESPDTHPIPDYVAPEPREKTLLMPRNVNQNFEGYTSTINRLGCALCCGVDVSCYFGTSVHNTVAYFFEHYWYSYGYSWQAPNAVIKEMSASGAELFRAIKSEIDADRPVILHATGNNTQHWVVGYGYQNDAKTAKDIFVLDPYNATRSDANGTLRTLDDAMRITCGKNYKFSGRLKFTEPK